MKQKCVYLLEVCGETSADSAFLRRRVNANEYQIRLLDPLVYISREEEVSASGLTDDFDETRLVDGQSEVGTIPGINPVLVEVDNGDLNVRAFKGDYGASGATCSTGQGVNIRGK